MEMRECNPLIVKRTKVTIKEIILEILGWKKTQWSSQFSWQENIKIFCTIVLMM